MTTAYVEFFKDLAGNNNRDWFHENKKRYETDVKKPFYALVDRLIKKANKINPAIDIEPKEAIFRIHRDIRFSKDKTPYKLHMSAVVNPGGRKAMSNPGIYFHIGPEAMTLATGCYMPDKEQLTQIRHSIIENYDEVGKILKNKTLLKYFPKGLQGDKNKILPKEFKPYAESHPLIFFKQYYLSNEVDVVPLIETGKLEATIIGHLKAASQWNNFLVDTLKLN